MTRDGQELREWLLKSLEGDKEAYLKFLGEVSQRLRVYLMKNTGVFRFSQERVEDLLQDTLLSIHLKKDTYRPEMPILPWIYSIARYRCIDSMRSEARRAKTFTLDPEVDSLGGLEEGRGIDDCLSDSFEARDLLEQLSPQQRRIVLLSKGDGMPLADVGIQMKMSLSAVKVSLHRALKKLKKNKR